MVNFSQLLGSFQHVWQWSLMFCKISRDVKNEIITVALIPVISPYINNLSYLTAWQNLPVFLCNTSLSLYVELLLYRIQYSGPDLCTAKKYPPISLKPRLSSWIIYRSTQRPYFQSHLSKPDPQTTSSVQKRNVV